ncbi:hypothetical protein RB195_006222 [Necator americanus]|uniref:RING-type E3 ubiquitin transferase n=1 Tax=Necator americanus TaxID=51031 RepID=A0ABR1BUE9_NECAM
MNNLPFSSANAEGKELSLDDYDRIRTPHKSLADNTELRLRAGTLSTELSCPICLDLLTQTMTTKECLHRFCAECITTALFRGNKECPTCRKKLVSKRSLRPDPNFDSLIAKIWPDRKTYDELQSVASEKFAAQTNMDALRSSIEEGIKAQEVNRRKRVQGSYECEKRKKRREEDGAPNGPDDGADNDSNSPTDEDGDAAAPVAWSGNNIPAPGLSNDFLEEEEIIDELDLLTEVQMGYDSAAYAYEKTEEELQAEYEELDEVEVEIENEDIEQEYKSDDESDSSSSTYSSSGASSLVSSTPSSSLSVSDCSGDPPPPAAFVNGSPSDTPLIEVSRRFPKSATPPMVMQTSEDIGQTTNTNATMSDMSPLTSGSQQSTSAHGVQPPVSVLHPKERLNQWLDENPSSPHIPEENMNDPLQRRTDDSDMYDPPLSGADEIEAELLPSAALLRRQCPAELMVPRYIRTKHDTTMEHLAEFIHLRVMEEVQSNQSDFDADPVPTVPRPQHFYVFSRNDGHHIRKIFLHETMLTAQSAMTRDDHLIIFFDTEPPQLREEKSSVLEDVVHAHFLSLPHV